MIGISASLVTRIELAERVPSLESIYGFSKIFRIPFLKLISIAYPGSELPKTKNAVILPETIEDKKIDAISSVVNTIIKSNLSENELGVLCDLIKAYSLSKDKSWV